MYIKQLSVFMENRAGRLGEVTSVLAENNINIICVSLADTAEYGVFRMIVSNPKMAQEVLNGKGFSSILTDVIGVKLPNHFGMLNLLAKTLSDNKINLSYMYALNSGDENAAVIIKTDDNDAAIGLIKEKGLEMLPSVEVYNL